MEAHLTGVFPRSERLVEGTRAAERGKILQTEVDALVDRDAAALIDLQRNAGFDSIIDGQLNWQDLFRPFTELFSGIHSGGLTRWFDNNTFFKQPVVADKIDVKSSSLEQFFKSGLIPPEAQKKAILPGPFTFALLAQNSYYPSFADLTDDLARALSKIVSELGRLGYSYLQFNEPALSSKGRTKEDFELTKHALETCVKGFSGKTTLQTYFGNVAPMIDYLLDFPVNVLGLDFYATPLDKLADRTFTKELGCGCVDGRNSLLESAQGLQNFVAKVQEVIEPKGIVLCPNCDLDFLPQSVAEKKVRVLGEAKSRLNR